MLLFFESYAAGYSRSVVCNKQIACVTVIPVVLQTLVLSTDVCAGNTSTSFIKFMFCISLQKMKVMFDHILLGFNLHF